MKKKKTNNENSETLLFVRALQDGDNVKAYKMLEKAMKKKVAKKIDDAMKDL